MKRVFLFLILITSPLLAIREGHASSHHCVSKRSFVSSAASKESAKEPTLQAVQQEAVRVLGFDAQEMETWRKRARWSAALPRLQAGFRKDTDDVVRLSTTDSISLSGGEVFVGPDKNDFYQNFNQGTTFEVKAAWALDELAFNRDSLDISRERREWMREKMKTIEAVTEAYVTRRRLLRELVRKPAGNASEDTSQIREKKKQLLDRAQAVLDALTEGWFSRQISGDEK